jgi:hypothetical protein
MPILEERVAFLEGQSGEHSRVIDGIREAMGGFERRLEQGFARTDLRIDKLEQRFDRFELRMDRFEQRMDRFEERLDRLDEKIDQRYTSLDDKVSRHFMWLVGMQVTTLVAIVATLLRR